MRKPIIAILTIACALLISNKVWAQQDPNFTLYNFNMNIINPAFAGIKDSPELNLVYRSQYLGMEDSPRTLSMAYSKGMGKNLGLGISVVHDRVFVLAQTDLALDISYRLKISEGTNIYLGVKAGGGLTNIDLTRANAPGNDPLFGEDQNFFNPHVGAGLNVRNKKFYLSLSTPNFLKGERYEKSGNTPTTSVNNAHFYIGTGYHIGIDGNLMLTPRFMMRTVQGAPTSYDLGASLDFGDTFVLGTNVRIAETVSLYTLIRVIEKLRLGFAYDISTTDINEVNDKGSLEFILKYQL